MAKEMFPLGAPGKVHHNLSQVALIEAAVRRGEVIVGQVELDKVRELLSAKP